MKTLTQQVAEALGVTLGGVLVVGLVLSVCRYFEAGSVQAQVAAPPSTLPTPKCRCTDCECGAVVKKSLTTPTIPDKPASLPAKQAVQAPAVFPPGHPVAGMTYRLDSGRYIPISSFSSPCPGGVCGVPQRGR